MAEDAKHAADEVAEKKSGQEQEQTNIPKDEVTEETKPVTEEVKPTAEAEAQTTEANTTDEKVTETGAEAKKDEMVAEKSEDTGEKDDQEAEKVDDADANKTETKDTETKDEDDDKEIAISIELDADKVGAKDEDFQKSVREQIENCKFEIVSAIQDNVHKELQTSEKLVRKMERRRRAGFWVRDIIILLLAGLVGYFGYCLYDAQYFDFMRPICEREGNCPVPENDDSKKEDEKKPESEEVKDTAWYVKNYGSLFDALKVNLDADKVDAYYIYSGDYKVSDIQPDYLLSMAYNRLNANTTYDSANGIMIPATDLRTAFTNLFGTADYFVKKNFMNGCVEFEYDKASDSFITPAMQCITKSDREIIEEVDEAYEEGNALYFITTAAIFDKSEQAFYSFDNLFKSVASNVQKTDFAKHKAFLNRYQYRFKKVDDNYYFSDIVKLK